jgi:hypothetical protein
LRLEIHPIAGGTKDERLRYTSLLWDFNALIEKGESEDDKVGRYSSAAAITANSLLVLS